MLEVCFCLHEEWNSYGNKTKIVFRASINKCSFNSFLHQEIIGDRYSFAIDHEDFGMMYLFNGNLAMLIWKSGNMLIREIKYQSEDDKNNKIKSKSKRNMRFNQNWGSSAFMKKYKFIIFNIFNFFYLFLVLSCLYQSLCRIHVYKPRGLNQLNKND